LFAFHAINAYEVDDDIILDLSDYDDTGPIAATYLSSLRSPNKPPPEMIIGRARRFRLPAVSSTQAHVDGSGRVHAGLELRDAEQVFRLPQEQCIELPCTNPAYAHKRYRYAYGISRAHPDSDYADQLVKLDIDAAAAGKTSDAATFWFEDGATPGEPIFVASPGGVEEDDGVLLSVVLDGKRGKSAVVVLDARNMRELGRAEMDGAFPQGYHGLWVG
jgi:torulene dioxygenase